MENVEMSQFYGNVFNVEIYPLFGICMELYAKWKSLNLMEIHGKCGNVSILWQCIQYGNSHTVWKMYAKWKSLNLMEIYGKRGNSSALWKCVKKESAVWKCELFGNFHWYTEMEVTHWN